MAPVEVEGTSAACTVALSELVTLVDLLLTTPAPGVVI